VCFWGGLGVGGGGGVEHLLPPPYATAGKCGKCSMKSLAKMYIINRAPCIPQAKSSRTRLENVSTELQLGVIVQLRHPYLGL